MPQIVFPIKQSSAMNNFVNGFPVIMKPQLLAYPIDPITFHPGLSNISQTGLSEGEQAFYNLRKKKSPKTIRSSKSERPLDIVDLNSLRNRNKEVYNIYPLHGIPNRNDYQYVELGDISSYYGTDDYLKYVKRKERSERNKKRTKREVISEVKDSAESEVTVNYGTVAREKIKIGDISNEPRIGRTVPNIDNNFKFNTRTGVDVKRETFNTKDINSWMNTCRLKRQVLSNGLQVRGGQDCADRSTPPNADPRTYHESAHCLRFSDLWYTVYRVREPVTEHAVHIQLFEKHSLVDGTVYWRDLTRGNTVSLGYFQRHVKDELPTLSFKYSSVKNIVTGPFSLDPDTARILIPQPVPPSKVEMYPQLQGGPNEYLVVDNEEISFDGEECDKAGVGFEAFVKQPDRCAKPKGTCLKNQPVHFWRSDIEARVAGRKGRYFLENYGTVPRKPVKTNYSSDETFLALEYQGKHTSLIDVELKADFNAVVRLGSSARITGVIVDSTNPDTTVISIMVTNLGLASSAYKVRIDDCPSDAPPSWSKQESHLLTIPPQQCHVFHLQLSGVCGMERVYCSLEVVNHHHELVATRRIRVQRNDRCFCLWHCLCACIGSVNGLQCEPMTAEHYHAAGFRGSLPVPTQQGPLCFIYDFWFNVLVFGLSMLFVMLFLGFLKALFGLCCPTVGVWGLGMLIDPRTQDRYYESHLAGRKVVYDDEGYPVHPCTGERTVRMTSKIGEFCLNLIFFLAFPFVILTALCRRCCNRSPYDCDAEAGTCFRWTNSAVTNRRDYRKECPCPYERACDSEEEDTKYVMGELQRSRESNTY
ncbi:hapless 2 [Anabrus simplex]|uniref:hapless 2 n=1 Tax=Anabrus simplex TaxID=316456 RepID=UPI0035A29717